MGTGTKVPRTILGSLPIHPKMKITPDEFLADYIHQANTHSFDAVAPRIDEAAVFWFSSGSHRGLDEIRAAFERTWSIIHNEQYWLEDVEWLTLDAASATCIYTFHWQGSIDGVSREGNGRGTTIVANDGQRWRVVHEHLSAHP